MLRSIQHGIKEYESLVPCLQRTRDILIHIFYYSPEGEDSMFLRNFCTYLRVYTASNARMTLSTPPQRKYQISGNE